MAELRNCRCGAEPNTVHAYGCDVERCARCGMQAIGCNCIYIVNGMDPDLLEEEHPDIYTKGPTPAMYRKWDKQWKRRRVKWSGEYPGLAECREYGFWCVGPPWKRVEASTPGAIEDLNRLYVACVWDAEKQKLVLPEGR